MVANSRRTYRCWYLVQGSRLADQSCVYNDFPAHHQHVGPAPVVVAAWRIGNSERDVRRFVPTDRIEGRVHGRGREVVPDAAILVAQDDADAFAGL